MYHLWNVDETVNLHALPFNIAGGPATQTVDILLTWQNVNDPFASNKAGFIHPINTVHLFMRWAAIPSNYDVNLIYVTKYSITPGTADFTATHYSQAAQTDTNKRYQINTMGLTTLTVSITNNHAANSMSGFLQAYGAARIMDVEVIAFM